MKLCIPVAANQGVASEVFGHFGSAPVFAVHDTEAGRTEFIDNETAHHEHGSCNPLKALGDQAVDAILVGAIGGRAIAKLNEAGIRVYRAIPGTLEQTLATWAAGNLQEIEAAQACSHHGGCAH